MTHAQQLREIAETMDREGCRISANEVRFVADELEQQVTPVATAWDEGYRQGVEDERTSEANIGIAGFGAKVTPARQNPYRTTPSVRVDSELDDEHPLWLVNEQIKGLLEGEGATEDHDDVVAFLSATGLPKPTVARMHKALVFGDTKVIATEAKPSSRRDNDEYRVHTVESTRRGDVT